MPRSSRSKSHKQSKHSSKEAAASTAREYSGSDEDVKMKEKSSNGGKEDVVSFRISKDSSVSGERRKHGKDLFSSHGNGDVSEEYTTSSKRREDKSHGGSDRWNGGSSDEKGVVVNIENKESSKSKDFSKVVGESKSKSSRRHDAESVVVLEKDEGKSGSGNRGEKRKSEKESARKESSQHKENKESKDKERGSDRGKKAHPDKLEPEASSKQVENQSSKRGKESTDWPIEEGLRNPELEKELEKRMRRRGEASSDKDKYQDDIKESDDRRLSVKRHKDEGHGEDGVRESRQRDEKHREDDRKSRDVKHRGESERHNKHREDSHRDSKYKDDKYTETGEKEERSRDGKRKQDDDREYRHKEDKKHRDDTDRDKRSRDSKYKDSHTSIEPEPKRMKDDNVYDDRASRYKDDKDRRRGNDKEDGSEYRSRSLKEQSEKRSVTKVDSGSERGRISSRYADMEVTGGHSHSHSRRRSSPSRDHHRVSKQEENKHRDYEERSRHSRDFTSEKLSSRSTEKVNAKDEDKSPSSRRSVDLEEPGQRSGGGSKDAKENHTVKDTHPDNNDYSQVDGDNLSVSSPYTRSSSHFRPGSDSPFFGSTEDDRNKSNNNRHRRMSGGDNNMNRGQGNWKNIPNWPSPMPPGGYMPFQHVPPPMFHPLMQQFPPPIFGRPPMKLNPGLPYHVPDHGRPLSWRDESVPPPLHGWDANNTVFGDESHLYGWDRRNQMNNRGWEPSGEMWKAQNQMDVQLGSQKLNDENWSGQIGQAVENDQNQMDVQVSTFTASQIERNTPEVEKVTESPQIFEDDDNKNSLVSQVYLSRVDVSQDLTQPDLYDQYTSMMDLDKKQLPDEFECNILFLEEGVEANVTDGNSVFAAKINDSVFQKAMFLYKKQKEESGPPITEEKGGADEAVEEEVNKEAVIIQKLDTDVPVNEANKSMEARNMEVDDVVVVVVKQEEEECDGGLVLVDCKVEKEEENEEGASDVVGESIEFGSKVNLSRIHHHSPESTH